MSGEGSRCTKQQSRVTRRACKHTTSTTSYAQKQTEHSKQPKNNPAPNKQPGAHASTNAPHRR